MAYSSVVKTLRDGQILIKDGTGTPKTITVAFEQGDLTLNIPGPEVLVFLDRNRLGTTPSLRYGKEQPVTGSFSAYFKDNVEAGVDTLEAALLLGMPTGWVSTLGSSAEVQTVSLVWTIEGSDHGDTSDNVITLNHCTISGSITEGDPLVMNFSFVAHDQYPTIS